ncbi:MAG: fibronectin type III domain-containing protein, partial [Elusimicrobiota bacterium]
LTGNRISGNSGRGLDAAQAYPSVPPQSIFSGNYSWNNAFPSLPAAYDLDTGAPGGDTTAPTLAFSYPTDGSTVSGLIGLLALASDDVGVAGVQFKLDGVNLGAEELIAPYEISWLTTGASNGAHTLSAVARDAAGNSQTAAVSVTVNNADITAPTVAITAPANGAAVSGSVALSGTAADNVAVSNVAVSVDGGAYASAAGAAGWTFSLNTFALANGAHNLTVRATDSSGNTKTAAISVMVSNSAASLAPKAAYSFNAGSGATAADFTGNDHAGSLVNAAWTGMGMFGGALSFNGANAYVDIPDADSLTTSDLTLSAYVSLVSASTDMATVANKWAQDTNDEYLFGIDSSRRLSFGWQTTGGYSWGTPAFNIVTGVGQIPLGAMTNVAVVRSGTNISLYINGVLDSAFPGAIDANPFFNGTASVRIGGQSRGGIARFLNGSIDEVRIYGRALSPAELQSDMNTAVESGGDTAAPAVAFTAPAAGATVSGSAVAVSASASDNVGVLGVQFKLDGANTGAEDTSSPYAISWNTLGASNGAHALSAVARDAAGNTSTATVSVTVSNADTTAPTISAVASASISTGSAVIGWTTNEAADSQVEFGLTAAYGQSSALAAAPLVSHSAGLSGLSASTLYHYRVRSRDAAGNLATSGDFSFTTLAIPDATAPALSAVTAGSISSGSAVIGWTTNEPADTQVEFGLTAAYGQQSGLHAALTTSHSAALSGLSASTLYHYRVKSRDAAGNLGISGDFSFTTTAVPDATAPVISAVAAGSINSASALIGWITNEAADTQVEYGLTTAYGQQSALAAAPIISHSASLSGLNASMLYHYRVKSRDAAGNLAVSGDFTFATLAAPDATAPSLSAVAAGAISSGSAVIGWATNEAADTQVEYGLTTAYGQSSALAAALLTSHSAALSGLSASTLYHYRVKSRDAAGNLATSGDFSFTTLAIPDTTAPNISAVAAGSLNSGSAVISWTTNEPADTQVEFGLTAAYGQQSALAAGMITSHSAALSGLSASTLYHYRVKSRDAAGNLAASGDFSFTTTAAPDLAAPVISAVSAASVSSGSVVISWTTNEAADTQVEFGPTTAYGQSSALNASMLTSHGAGLSGLSASTWYHYRVKSRDAAGNLAASGDFSFTTLAVVVPVAVSVSPVSASVKATFNQQFTATVTGAANTGVTWSVNGVLGGNAAVGKISSGGLYSAPASVPNPATVTVTAKSTADTAKSGSASVTVLSKNRKTRVSLVLSPTVNTVLAAASPAAAPATAILTLRTEDAAFPDAAVITSQVVMPSGSKNLTLTRISGQPLRYYCSVASATFSSSDFHALEGADVTVTVGGQDFLADGEAGGIEPELGGLIKETSGLAQVIILP